MLYIEKKCQSCKYQKYCEYGVIGTSVTLLVSTIYMVPKLYKYVTKKLWSKKVVSQSIDKIDCSSEQESISTNQTSETEIPVMVDLENPEQKNQ